MGTGRLIQILVFVLAAVIVAVFIISGFHFVRSVYVAQLEIDRDRDARHVAHQVAQTLIQPRVVEMKEREGVIIQHPDGAEDIALTIVPEAMADLQQPGGVLPASLRSASRNIEPEQQAAGRGSALEEAEPPVATSSRTDQIAPIGIGIAPLEASTSARVDVTDDTESSREHERQLRAAEQRQRTSPVVPPGRCTNPTLHLMDEEDRLSLFASIYSYIQSRRSNPEAH